MTADQTLRALRRWLRTQHAAALAEASRLGVTDGWAAAARAATYDEVWQQLRATGRRSRARQRREKSCG